MKIFISSLYINQINKYINMINNIYKVEILKTNTSFGIEELINDYNINGYELVFMCVDGEKCILTFKKK